MGLFNKEKKAPTGDKAYAQGYVSFNPDDLRKHVEEAHVNARAYDYLDKALFTSSHVTEIDRRTGTVSDIDDVYPITLEETLEMEQYLDKAEQVADNPNESFFQERLTELRGIVNWSKERHWNFSWLLIVGVIVSIFVIFLISDNAAQDVKDEEKTFAQIEKWTKQDTTLNLASFAKEKQTEASYSSRYNSANAYKLYKLIFVGNQYGASIRGVERYTQDLDTVTTRSVRKDFQETIRDYEKDSKKYAKEFNELNEMDFKDIKKMAIKEQKAKLGDAQSSRRFAKFVLILFIILLPLYIFAERPYGYTISRTRTEAQVLGGIHKVGLALSGALLGAAGSIGFVDIVTKWSDGTTTREDDGSGPVRMALKIGLFVAAVLVFCAVSMLLVIYSTIMGLIRNYNWKEIYQNLKNKTQTDKQPQLS